MREATPPDPQRGTFFGHVNVVILTNVLDGGLAFASGVLVARALGPEGRGAFALFVVSAALGRMLLGLGFGNATVYFLNKRQLTIRQIVSAVHVVTIASPLATAAAILVVIPWAGDDVLGRAIPIWMLVAAVPALIWCVALLVTLQAQSRFIEMGIATVIQPVVTLTLVVFAYAADHPTPEQVAWFWIASNVASGGFALWRIGFANVDLRRVGSPNLRTLRTLASFGLQGEIGNVLQLLNYRLDQYMLKGFVSIAGVGVYAVGVSLTEAVWLLANAVAVVLLPRLTSAPDEDVRWMTPVATRNTLLVAAIGAAVLAVAAPVLVPAFFGHDYDGSVQALWWLLPGTVALTGSKVLTTYVFSQGKPLVNTMITVISLVVTFVALFALVPPFGVNGAAAASSLAYLAHFAAGLFAYRRISGESPLDAIIPRPSDLRFYTDAARGALARATGRRQLAPRAGG